MSMSGVMMGRDDSPASNTQSLAGNRSFVTHEQMRIREGEILRQAYYHSAWLRLDMNLFHGITLEPFAVNQAVLRHFWQLTGGIAGRFLRMIPVPEKLLEYAYAAYPELQREKDADDYIREIMEVRAKAMQSKEL